MWLYRSGRDGPAVVLYDYQQTRSKEHPRKFLAGFKGYLHVDGYAEYNEITDVTLVGCWAHARRKFDEVLKALSANKRIAGVTAKEGLEYCNHLFAIERKFKDATPEDRYNGRLAQNRPVIDAFLSWIEAKQVQMLPKSTLGEAVLLPKSVGEADGFS